MLGRRCYPHGNPRAIPEAVTPSSCDAAEPLASRGKCLPHAKPTRSGAIVADGERLNFSAMGFMCAA